jgi:hypothetical protein
MRPKEEDIILARRAYTYGTCLSRRSPYMRLREEVGRKEEARLLHFDGHRYRIKYLSFKITSVLHEGRQAYGFTGESIWRRCMLERWLRRQG